MYCCPNNGAHQLAVDINTGVSVLDDQSRPKPLFRNLTPSHVFRFPALDSPIDPDSPWMLLYVPSKPSPPITIIEAHKLLAYVVIRLDVAAKAGAGRC